MEGLESVIDSAKLNLRALLDKRGLEALLHLPDWDLVLKLLHEELHDVVALGMDNHSGQVIDWSLLQVADDKVATVLRSRDRHSVGRRNAQAAAHGEAEISRGAVLLAISENSRVEVLVEIDDRVLKMTIAASALALASRAVLMNLLSSACTVVAHVLAATFLADFDVCISMKFSNICCWDSTLAMEAINILTNDVFQVVLLHKLNHGHVSQRGVSLLNRLAQGGLISRSIRLSSAHSSCTPLLILELELVGCGFPAARTGLKDGVITGAVVGDTAAGADASASESNEVIRGQDHLSKKGDLLVKNSRRVEILALFFFVFDCSLCHFCSFES